MTDSSESKQGFFKRLRSKLNRPNSWLSYDLGNLVGGRQIDAAVLEELETRLLSADVGIQATTELLDALRKRVARKELADLDALMAALRTALADILRPCAKPLRIDASAHAQPYRCRARRDRCQPSEQFARSLDLAHVRYCKGFGLAG